MTTSEYAQMLRTWRLYDCSGARASPGDEVLVQLWRRWRGTRGKPVTATLAVAQESLDASWTAFVHRWNAEPHFADVVPIREERRRQHSVRELRKVVCELSWDADRVCCYVHYHGGCDVCHGFRIPRPSKSDWMGFVAEWPIGEEERVWIGRYRRALSEFERARSPSRARGRENYSRRSSRSRSRSPVRAHSSPSARLRTRSRTRSPSLARRAAASYEAPMCRSWGESRASGRDTPWSAGSTAPARDVAQRRDDNAVRGHDDREGARRSSAGAQRYPRAAEGHRDGNVYAAPEESHPAPAAAVPLAEELREIDRRVGFVGYDANTAMVRAELAEEPGERNSASLAELQRRLERLEQSNAALRNDNAVLRGQRRPDPPRTPRRQGPRYEPAVARPADPTG